MKVVALLLLTTSQHFCVNIIVSVVADEAAVRRQVMCMCLCANISLGRALPPGEAFEGSLSFSASDWPHAHATVCPSHPLDEVTRCRGDSQTVILTAYRPEN